MYQTRFYRADLCISLVQELRMRNLDTGVLGERYREDSLQIESGMGHFDLLAPECVRRHVEDVLAIVASERGDTRWT